MINNIEIKKVAEQKIKDIGGFLVDLKVSSSNVISLSFDKIEGVSFEDCLKKVEELSIELESGGLVLNDALQKYKLSMAIMERASALLASAKDELQVIDNEGEKSITRHEILNK